MKENFTKFDLKSGMIVEYADGNRRLVLESNGKIFLTGICIGFLDGYSIDLIHSVYSDLTINKVFEIKHIDTLDAIFNNNNLTLIWKRPKKVLELTLKEIAEKFEVDEIKIK